MEKILKTLETNRCLIYTKFKHTFDKAENGGAYI